VATYDYTDAQGQLLYQAVRYSPKGFSQRRPDPNGHGKERWIRNLNGVSRVLYRLPAILQAVKAGRRIFVVEGEEDVKILVARGLEATTNSEGAGKWHDEFSEVLRGAEIVVLRDNDEAGLRHRAHVVRSLWGKAASIKTPELPGVPDKGGDVRDWFKAGHSTEELLALIEQTPALTDQTAS
jgi:5S rRNA maturation endonuclease (ribonuclease M5)